MNKSIITGVVLTAVFASAFLMFKPSSIEEDDILINVGRQQSSAGNEHRSLIEQITQLKKENQALNARLTKADIEQCPTYQELAQNIESQVLGSECELLDKQKYVAIEEVDKIVQASIESTKYANWFGTNFKGNPDFNYIQTLKEEFDNEPTDNTQLAREFEKDLYDIFTNEKELAGFPFHQVICKQENCYVELGVYSSEEANNVPFQLQQQLENENKVFDISSIKSAYNQDNATLGLYLVKHRDESF